MYSFVFGFFCLTLCLWNLPLFFTIEYYTRMRTNNYSILLGFTTVYLSVVLWMSMLVVFGSGCCEYRCHTCAMCFGKCMDMFLLDIFLRAVWV